MNLDDLLKSINLSSKECVEEAMDLIMSKEIKIMNSLENNSLDDKVVSELLKNKEELAQKYYELNDTLTNLVKDYPDEPETGDVEL